MSLERFGIRWNGSHEPMATPMDDGYWTPWHIAEAEIAALRERCGRLAEEVKCRRERRTVHTCGPDMTGDCKACVRLGRIADAELAVDTHNDLAPAAKEQTDGR